VKKYVITKSALRKLALREYCKVNGHSPERVEYMLAAGSEERAYKCGNCDGRLVIEYPSLDYTIIEE
jgi:hypothetical protein